MSYRLRHAILEDAAPLRDLIGRSIRVLGSADYSRAQIEAALLGAFGLDTTLIADASYFVVQSDGGELLACGGWSRRRTLFGGDARPERDAALLDPATDAARIRAFFVDPAHARRGLGRALLNRCEIEAQRAGFCAAELMATLPGVRFYEACGYRAQGSVEYPLPGELQIRFVPMSKQLVDTK